MDPALLPSPHSHETAALPEVLVHLRLSIEFMVTVCTNQLYLAAILTSTHHPHGQIKANPK